MSKTARIAVIGAGLSGSRCAQRLHAAGHRVTVFDKARGPGGRLATRLQRWQDRSGAQRCTAFDHGAPGFEAARSQAFEQGFVAPALARGAVLAGAQAEAALRWLPAHPQPALCAQLLEGLSLRSATPVTALLPAAGGWALRCEAAPTAPTEAEGPFDAVLLAMPPAQAAVLLAPHRDDWARRASLVDMQPCWTLMAVTDAPAGGQASWLQTLPGAGPLAQVLRQDLRPSREAVSGEAHWVAHASRAWSRVNLEADPAWVQAQLLEALARQLGLALALRFALVHRWRYAQLAPPSLQALQPRASAWWSAQQRLGVCGDWLGGGGVEGAWLSGDALAGNLLESLDAVDTRAAQGA